MTGRERIEAAFSGEGARDLPAVIPYESVFLRDQWSRLTGQPWWYLYSPQADHHVRWTRDFVRAVGQDWLQMFPWAVWDEDEGAAIEVHPDGVYRIDRASGRRTVIDAPRVSGWTGEDVESVRPDRLPESIEEIDAVIRPLAEGETAAAAVDCRRRIAAAVIEAFGGSFWPYRHVSSPLWKTYDIWGFEGMMTMIATRPALVRHACERYLAIASCVVREAADHGAAGIWIEDCLTDLISPESFANLNVPYLRSLIEQIRSAGMKSIYYFCGNPAGKWDLVLALGMDALGLEESKKNFRIDVEQTVERVAGRCVVLGNLDAIRVLQNGSEEMLRAEIRRQVAAGRRNGSRFLMSLGSPVTPETPVERVRLYCEVVRELGAG